jgi:hypothetical protein
VQREYGLPVPGSSRNVFTWRHRPDVRAISDVMCGYIHEWSYAQVRLKLLPLLLEWDVRQGPAASLPLLSPAAASPGGGGGGGLQLQPPGVQFRPTGIRKVSSKGADAAANTGLPSRQHQGWRYVLTVERLQQGAANGGGGGGSSGPHPAAAGGSAGAEAEDLAIDTSWLAGTARSKPPKAATSAAAAPAAAAAAAAASGGGGDEDADAVDTAHYEDEGLLATQMPATQVRLGGVLLTSEAHQRARAVCMPDGRGARVCVPHVCVHAGHVTGQPAAAGEPGGRWCQSAPGQRQPAVFRAPLRALQPHGRGVAPGGGCLQVGAVEAPRGGGLKPET